jgi:hypothetical protein
MTTKELTDIVAKRDVTIAEINHGLAHLAHNILNTHESIKELETVAKHLLESANKRRDE